MIGRIFLGRYEAVRLLGEGGMGKVYLARQLDLGRQVVVKVMHDDVAADPKFRDRFQRETLLMARFAHPYAVSLFDASISDGPCIVMEYIRGVNLETLLAKNGRLSYTRVGRLITQLCEVLQVAHEQGLIHRDLKPANLMVVDHDTPREKVKVMDFGLAKLLDATALTDYRASSAEFAVGTPGYINPEQVKGDDVDHRGDLYSVGVMMYELLTGRLPFIGPSSMDLMLAHATEMPPRFGDLGLNIDIPEPIEACVFTCLEKNPADRPQSAAELGEMYEMAISMSHSGFGETTKPLPVRPTGPVLVNDPNTLAFTMEAWMPESIAIMKLRGYASDHAGQILESIPGMVTMKIAPAMNQTRGGSLSWLGFGRKPDPLMLELHLHQVDPQRGNKLLIQAVFRPLSISQLADAAWRERCTQSYVDLRGYLMGTG
ncbi:serine/threonine protein kinase [Zavarzinella formosa]|uniref:serine/threonine protein kinase n=1 Tax=Zavarzinella formosa TaxID=360055 RepID=UPI0003055B96|nr:serine/threonine-protein kinase [Zavarzinella formosa]